MHEWPSQESCTHTDSTNQHSRLIQSLSSPATGNNRGPPAPTRFSSSPNSAWITRVLDLWPFPPILIFVQHGRKILSEPFHKVSAGSQINPEPYTLTVSLGRISEISGKDILVHLIYDALPDPFLHSTLDSFPSLCSSLTSVASWGRSQPLSSIPHTKALNFIFGPSRIALTNTDSGLDYSTSFYQGPLGMDWETVTVQDEERSTITIWDNNIRLGLQGQAPNEKNGGAVSGHPRRFNAELVIFGFLSSFSYLLFSPLSTVLAVWHPKSSSFLAEHYTIPPKYMTFLGPPSAVNQQDVLKFDRLQSDDPVCDTLCSTSGQFSCSSPNMPSTMLSRYWFRPRPALTIAKVVQCTFYPNSADRGPSPVHHDTRSRGAGCTSKSTPEQAQQDEGQAKDPQRIVEPRSSRELRVMRCRYRWW
ncbi:hypothetical protein C8J56DRAFT_1170130 [Mycena floridula]|nr:hypothetical protein C8J56DRAFT_1170130 [Mycena floridula]